MRYIRYTRNRFIDFFLNLFVLIIALYAFAHVMQGIISYAQTHDGRLPGMLTPTVNETEKRGG